ncbi:MAG: ATP-dependent metallopeptidase FtsH/Yme1/Tma family protein, partial [Bacteroidia bacterium]
MSEEQNIKNEASKPEGVKKDSNAKEQFKKIKNKLPKNPNNFNFYWIYIVILVGLALMWFPNFTDNTKKIEWQEFVENYLKPGDVKRIVIINEQSAEIYIKPDRLKEPKFDQVRQRPITKEINPGPHFRMQINKESFSKDLEAAQIDLHRTRGDQDWISPESENRTGMSEYMGWIIPAILLIAVWFFLMRRMGGGAGPGGGNIFS